ncbi:hypothetical protein ASF60_22670 [Methylobacterium sp. Leaf113]|nr:hypothetical protein ASF60_22670 [Methylobacterium sp. Leaf113]
MRQSQMNADRVGRSAWKVPLRSLLILMLATFVTPALALDPQDTLRDWNAASSADRNRLLKQLEKADGGASRKDVVSCLDDAAGMAPHADLRVADVFMACAKQSSEKSI